jgi:outer membrane protein assembly factor BamD (BamD/ComL family)
LTIWSRKYWRLTKPAGPLWLALAAAALCVPTAPAQQTLDERYQKAIQFFNSAKMEDACDLFQQIEKESPGYKDIHTYLNPACDSARRAYEQEERLYKQGLDLFKQGQFEEAKQKFTQGRNLVLRHPKYRAEIEEYLKQIETRSREESLYQQAVQLFNDGRNDDAAAQFVQIEQAKGGRAADARGYLQRIKERRDAAAQKKAADSDQQAFDDAVKAFNDKRYQDAKNRFQSLLQKNSPHSADARSYLQQIDTAGRQEAAEREKAKKQVVEQGKDPKQVAQQLVAAARADLTAQQYAEAVGKLQSAGMLDPANHEAPILLKSAQEMLAEQPLRLGLEDYFQANYQAAEQQFDTYVANHGAKVAVAYFFRGASHASLYFLSGEHDIHQKDLAMADFRTLQKDSPQFRPPKEYVSPKILSLYSESARQKSP